eukprot:6531794-Pyramimonas_sp.AAC.1
MAISRGRRWTLRRSRQRGDRRWTSWRRSVRGPTQAARTATASSAASLSVCAGLTPTRVTLAGPTTGRVSSRRRL